MARKYPTIIGVLALSFLSLTLIGTNTVNASDIDGVWYTAGQADCPNYPNICLTITPDYQVRQDIDIEDNDGIQARFDLHLFVGQMNIPNYMITSFTYSLYFCPVNDNNTANATVRGGTLSAFMGEDSIWVNFLYSPLTQGNIIYVTAIFVLEVWDSTPSVVDWITDTQYCELHTY